MAQEQNYQVNYSINVDASQGTKQVIAFGEAVGKLVQAKASLTPAVTNIKNMMDEIDRVFRTKNGKKRNFDYRLTIDTKKSEEKLERIKGLLTDISTLSKGISLTINAGQALDSKKIKANAKSLYEKRLPRCAKRRSKRMPPRPLARWQTRRNALPKPSGKSTPPWFPWNVTGNCKSRPGRRKTGCSRYFPYWVVSKVLLSFLSTCREAYHPKDSHLPFRCHMLRRPS